MPNKKTETIESKIKKPAKEIAIEAPKGKILNGIVTSAKMDKTAVITVLRKKLHPIYKKQYTVTNKFFADDPNNVAKEGDVVTIRECKPLSKKKRWQIVKIAGNNND